LQIIPFKTHRHPQATTEGEAMTQATSTLRRLIWAAMFSAVRAAAAAVGTGAVALIIWWFHHR
jgi:hypothetical protein